MIETQPAPHTVAAVMPDAVVAAHRDRDGIETMVARIAHNELDIDGLATHTIAFNVGRPFTLDARIDGRATGAAMPTGALKIVPAGPHSTWRWASGLPIEMLHVSVTDTELRAQARELDIRGDVEIATLVGQIDAGLLQLARAMSDERLSSPIGTLVGDALRIDFLAALLRGYSSLARAPALRRADGRLGLSELRRIDAFVDAHLDGPVGIADLAALTGASRFHFARAFKATTGISPYAYVLDRRIERARSLLERSTLSVAAIAAATGFSDQSHLTRHIKRRYGIAPGAVRGERAARMF